MRFLVVDDSSTMRRIMINTLNRIGHQDIVEATTAREALERLAVEEIDLVITDWNMPEMSGVEFIRTMRQQDRFRQLPVMMVTTNAAMADIVEAMKAGVTSYVVKPFTTEVIREKIEAALARPV
jgi:two-component system chemotaxis response regulator CheY